jgi:hypothetical protein
MTEKKEETPKPFLATLNIWQSIQINGKGYKDNQYIQITDKEKRVHFV